jgi:hypothetical protein
MQDHIVRFGRSWEVTLLIALWSENFQKTQRTYFDPWPCLCFICYNSKDLSRSEHLVVETPITLKRINPITADKASE